MAEIVLPKRWSREGLQGLREREAWSAWKRSSAIELREGLFGEVSIFV